MARQKLSRGPAQSTVWATKYAEESVLGIEPNPFERFVIFAATPKTLRERWSIFRGKARPSLHVLRQEDVSLYDAAIFM